MEQRIDRLWGLYRAAADRLAREERVAIRRGGWVRFGPRRRAEKAVRRAELALARAYRKAARTVAPQPTVG